MSSTVRHFNIEIGACLRSYNSFTIFNKEPTEVQRCNVPTKNLQNLRETICFDTHILLFMSCNYFGLIICKVEVGATEGPEEEKGNLTEVSYYSWQEIMNGCALLLSISP